MNNIHTINTTERTEQNQIIYIYVIINNVYTRDNSTDKRILRGNCDKNDVYKRAKVRSKAKVCETNTHTENVFSLQLI